MKRSLGEIMQFSEHEFLLRFNHFLFPLIIPLLILVVIFLFKRPLFSATSKTKNLPPSPPTLPIIGNFHQLGDVPYRALWSLAQSYGPLMLLHFGQVPVVVVSSPDASREVMKTNDLAFASRPELSNLKHLFYNMKEVFGLPYGEEWRQLRRLFVLHLLSKKRVQSFHAMREEETALLVTKISESCSSSKFLPVDLTDLFMTLSNDVGCRAAFGQKYEGESKDVQKLKHLFCEFITLVGAFTFRDYIPMLGWLDYLSGMDARVKKVVKGIDVFLEGLIKERTALLEEKRARGVNLDDDKQDFIETLITMQKDNTIAISLDRYRIKALLLDAYVGGTDTISTSIEWAMAELLRNPNSMKKLQSEVKEVLNGKLEIGEDDMEKMVFLKAVIKESFRMHTAGTILSRKNMQDTKVMGYDIPAGTMILINVWGIANDPKLWDEPQEFRPERFLNSSVDFQGHDFKFTPFGAGRRQCPGITYSSALIEYVLANLLYKFDWELSRGIKGEEINMTEKLGSAVHQKKTPLLAIATPSY